MKKYKRKAKKRIMKFILLQVLMVLIVIACSKSLFNMIDNDNPDTSFPSAISSITEDVKTAEGRSVSLLDLAGEELNSNNAILICIDGNKVLYDKQSNETIYPASLTKIMTAIVVIENLDSLSDQVTLSPDLFEKLYEEGASMAGFLPGETVLALDLLYGILLPSGAESCVGLCDYIAGSERSFVDLMNEKAEDLDMHDTHFTNSTGLDDSDHYSTVADLALLLEYALQNDTFRDIFTSKKHVTEPTDLHPDGITFYSTMFENMPTSEFKGGSILGGKTGYTDKAGLCLASLSIINDKEYILVTAGANGNHNTQQYNITDALMMYGCIHQ